MSLKAFSIANFKAFGASQRIPLRPITLIYGANSSGKSSAIHALALAHHAVETGDLDVQRTVIGGESIDLGGFRQYVHLGRDSSCYCCLRSYRNQFAHPFLNRMWGMEVLAAYVAPQPAGPSPARSCNK